MKAAIFHKPGLPLSVEEIDLTEPKAGEVLVNIVGAGVCHSDYHIITGDLKVPNVPVVMGHEGAGIVGSVGSGVSDFLPGDKVIFSMDFNG